MKPTFLALVQAHWRRTWWDVSRPTLAERALISAQIKQPQSPVIAHSLVCFQLGDVQWPLRLYRRHGKSWRLASLWTSASPERAGGVGMTSNFYSPWIETHENSIHGIHPRHRSPRLSKVLSPMIGWWLVMIGKVVQSVGPAEEPILALRRFFPLTMWAQLWLCRINIGPSFCIFVSFSSLPKSHRSATVLSSFVWVVLRVLIILVGNEVDCNVLPQLPLHFQAVLTKPPLCESTNLKDYRTLCRFTEPKACESSMELSACHVCIGRDRSG